MSKKQVELYCTHKHEPGEQMNDSLMRCHQFLKVQDFDINIQIQKERTK